ncbi:hypothetical protein OF83DRAFT_1085751 [Amylostereum chailletii]|nr:hypothetical protein OF83DRAFT_1085751 [Amylostereum chailletii]
MNFGRSSLRRSGTGDPNFDQFTLTQKPLCCHHIGQILERGDKKRVIHSGVPLLPQNHDAVKQIDDGMAGVELRQSYAKAIKCVPEYCTRFSLDENPRQGLQEDNRPYLEGLTWVRSTSSCQEVLLSAMSPDLPGDAVALNWHVFEGSGERSGRGNCDIHRARRKKILRIKEGAFSSRGPTMEIGDLCQEEIMQPDWVT